MSEPYVLSQEAQLEAIITAFIEYIWASGGPSIFQWLAAHGGIAAQTRVGQIDYITFKSQRHYHLFMLKYSHEITSCYHKDLTTTQVL